MSDSGPAKDRAVSTLADVLRRTAHDVAEQARRNAPLSTGAIRSTATAEGLAILRRQAQ